MVIHAGRPRPTPFAVLREHASRLPAVILHCFSAPDRIGECVERGYLCSFAGNVTYPRRPISSGRLAEPRPSCSWSRQTRPTSPQPRRGRPNEPANVVHTARHVAGLRDVPYDVLERTVEDNAARVFGW